MANIFSRLNDFIWRGVHERIHNSNAATPRKPDKIPAPEDLFNMAIEAIRKQSLTAIEETERTGEIDNSWKHRLEEMVYSGAFSDDQQVVLQEVFSEVTRNVAVAHARIMVTRILCNATEQPKEQSIYSATGKMLSKGPLFSGITWK